MGNLVQIDIHGGRCVACDIGVATASAAVDRVDTVKQRTEVAECAIGVVAAAELHGVGAFAVHHVFICVSADELVVAAGEIDEAADPARILHHVVVAAAEHIAGDAAGIGENVASVTEKNILVDATAVGDRVRCPRPRTSTP